MRGPGSYPLVRRFFCACLLLAGCSGSVPEPVAPADDAEVPTFVLRGARTATGEPIELEVQDGLIVAPGTLADDVRVIDAQGFYVVPGVIDAHVHLAYYPVADQLPATGIVGAVDLAAPEAFLDRTPAPGRLRVRSSGPMITAVEGYPTESWGHDGYGIECSTASDAERAIERLASRGAALVKIALAGEPELDEATLIAAVTRAHAMGLKVAAHALTDEEAARAGRVGVDVLAHTPVTALSPATVAMFADRAVVSTLLAFGARDSTIANLASLHQAGARVFYGTDLGNTRAARIQASELALLREAGLTPAEILAAATTGPAEYFGFDGLGSLQPGAAASFLLIEGDPMVDEAAIATPRAVYVDGMLAR